MKKSKLAVLIPAVMSLNLAMAHAGNLTVFEKAQSAADGLSAVGNPFIPPPPTPSPFPYPPIITPPVPPQVLAKINHAFNVIYDLAGSGPLENLNSVEKKLLKDNLEGLDGASDIAIVRALEYFKRALLIKTCVRIEVSIPELKILTERVDLKFRRLESYR